jgi:hypothetical protein
MSRVFTLARRAMGTLVVVGLSVRAQVVAVLLIVVALAVLCWILRDPGRSERFTTMIWAVRGVRRRSPRLRGPDPPASDAKRKGPGC